MPHLLTLEWRWVLLAGLVVAVTEAPVTTGLGAGQSPAAVYASALQHLQSVSRLQLTEIAHVYVQHPATVHAGFRYIAPDKVATLVQSKRAEGTIVTVEQIQVGTITCQAPPAWLCYRHPRQSIVALVRTYIQPQVGGLQYSSSPQFFGSGKKRRHATAIHLSGQAHGTTYQATLVVNDTSRLPVSFTSMATMKGKPVATQNVAFVYGGSFTVKLPKGKNVHLPKP